MNKSGTFDHMTRESVLRTLTNREEPEESAEELVSLAERYGAVHVYRWRTSDDAWGAHWSLTVSYHPDRMNKYRALVERVPHW